MALAIDPVCAMEVDTDTSDLRLEHDGKTFCGNGCLLECRDDPEKYLDPDHMPSMKGGVPGASANRRFIRS